MAAQLMPIEGIDNVSKDDALTTRTRDSVSYRARDIINFDVSPTGMLDLRKGERLVSETPFKNIWQSPLHKDVFGTLHNDLVKIDVSDWSYISLGVVGDKVNFEVVNNLVYVGTPQGLYSYNGKSLEPLTIDTPAPPILIVSDDGTLLKGQYTVAISLLRGQLESGLSNSVSVDIDADDTIERLYGGSFDVKLPYILDETITGIRIYVSDRDGTQLRFHSDVPANTTSLKVVSVDNISRVASNGHLSPMLSGDFMSYWQGRLITASRNIIRFSQPLAYHLHDERYDYVQMPQRVTFLIGLDTGLWVGQVDHVVYLSGKDIQSLDFNKKTAHAPVPKSAIEIDADSVGRDLSNTGEKVCVWLAENGYVVGTASGAIYETNAGRMKGISAKSGRSVRYDRRVITKVT